MSTKLTSSDIIQKASPALFSGLFGFLFEEEKPLYKATIEAVAKQRKLRPVFIERKPRNERFAWLQEALGRKASDAIAGHILQIWLVGKHKALLCDFLDALGIKHDENGTVEQLPPQPETPLLEKAVNDVLQKHDPEVVAVYLHAFQALNETGWENLDTILEKDERLQIGKPAAV
ncbi:MAG TPA: hypothetical protein VG733_10905 [Chthoniobacteraceae bacterium]|nr:hypothetical protein [Chthoniobacteraceae bacterium]